jgi:hypothetical protein
MRARESGLESNARQRNENGWERETRFSFVFLCFIIYFLVFLFSFSAGFHRCDLSQVSQIQNEVGLPESTEGNPTCSVTLQQEPTSTGEASGLSGLSGWQCGSMRYETDLDLRLQVSQLWTKPKPMNRPVLVHSWGKEDRLLLPLLLIIIRIIHIIRIIRIIRIRILSIFSSTEFRIFYIPRSILSRVLYASMSCREESNKVHTVYHLGNDHLSVLDSPRKRPWYNGTR